MKLMKNIEKNEKLIQIKHHFSSLRMSPAEPVACSPMFVSTHPKKKVAHTIPAALMCRCTP